MATLFENFSLTGYLSRKLIPIYLTRQVLARHALKRIETQKGNGFSWLVSTAAQDLRTYGRYATFNVGERTDELYAFLDWAQFVMVSSYSGLEQAMQGKEGNLDDGTIRRIQKIVLEKLEQAAPFRLNREFVQGNGQALNSMQGNTLTGLSSSVVESPATGIYANLNRAALTDWRNGTLAPTAGPAGDPQADALYLLFRAKLIAGRARKAGFVGHDANILLGTEEILADIWARWHDQKTDHSANVGSIKSAFGFEIGEGLIEDDLPGNHLYVLSGDAFCTATTASGMSSMFHLDERNKLPFHVRTDDVALVWYSEPMQFVNKWPKAHCIVPNWHN